MRFVAWSKFSNWYEYITNVVMIERLSATKWLVRYYRYSMLHRIDEIIVVADDADHVWIEAR